MTERPHFPFSLSCTGEGNGNPLQCSCLENPRDGGASWAAVHGIAQSWTRLKPLSSSSSHLLGMTQQYLLAFMATQLSSSGISHHNLLPHTPLICLSAVNSSPRPGIAPQSLNSSFQPLHLPGDLHPCLGYVWLWQRLSDSHSI